MNNIEIVEVRKKLVVYTKSYDITEKVTIENYKPMGAEDSRPLFNPEESVLELSQQNLDLIPYKIKENSIVKMNLQYNKIRKLPKRATRVSHLVLSSNELNELPETMINRILTYTYLNYLDLSINDLKNWPDKLSKLNKLRTLDLHCNKIEKIKILSRSLHTLILGTNRLTELPEVPKTLLCLNLDFNRIKELKSGCEFARLQKLSLPVNSLERIDENLNFPLLEYLDIGRNRLKELPDMSKIAPKLKIFECSDNFLTEFPKLPGTIKEFAFRNNELNEVPNFFELFENLTTIDISENNIKHLSRLPTSCTFLAAHTNGLEEIEDSDTPNLKRVFLMHNNLKKFPIFENNELEEAYFSFNEIENFDNFHFNQTLTKIDISHNQIKELPDALFGIPTLQTIYAINNKIKIVPESFSQSSITVFNISSNPLKKFPKHLPESLQKIYVSYCGLVSIPSTIKKSKNLEELVAYGNQLKSIPKIPNLKTLLLSQNQFSDFPKLPKSLTILDFSYNNFTTLPDKIKLPNVIDIDFSHNDIENLPSNFEIPQIKYLKLSYNKRLATTPKIQKYSSLLIINAEGTKIIFNKLPAIRELMTNQANLFHSPFTKLIQCGSNVGYSEMCGIRDAMEDAILVRENIKDNISAYGVFDGHGGAKTSTVAVYKFTQYFQQNGEFSADYMCKTLLKVNEDIRRYKHNDGSTVAIALRQENKILTAHLGDARAIIVKDDGTISFATKDHKPSLRSEYERVRDADSNIIAGRVYGILAITRSIGDFKVVGLSYEPEINEYEIEDDDKWMIIGCDGIWDVIFPEIVCSISQEVNNATEFAFKMRNMAYSSMSFDNISVIVVDLKKRSKPPKHLKLPSLSKMYSNVNIPLESIIAKESEDQYENRLLNDKVSEIPSLLSYEPTKFDDETPSSSSNSDSNSNSSSRSNGGSSSESEEDNSKENNSEEKSHKRSNKEDNVKVELIVKNHHGTNGELKNVKIDFKETGDKKATIILKQEKSSNPSESSESSSNKLDNKNEAKQPQIPINQDPSNESNESSDNESTTPSKSERTSERNSSDENSSDSEKDHESEKSSNSKKISDSESDKTSESEKASESDKTTESKKSSESESESEKTTESKKSSESESESEKTTESKKSSESESESESEKTSESDKTTESKKSRESESESEKTTESEKTSESIGCPEA
ncbi:protein phosphatase 2C [Tritrichomonas foetus]|uniref:Protein phosphatase 2C n=1 Tax=Tritrichomonas foetus TaxID=1144522 RepID=A0A1J4KKF8_9EUKA|nr:protein phosphatase 2C [Tritrichomonas foetus]|eukprot:OHT11715.1 protein phosphatase 2C [Tritrichomonas foetus]